jgi:hypothetical protein
MASVWKIHDSGVRAGMAASGLLSRSPAPAGPWVSTSAVTSQWPPMTPAMARARSASTARSLSGGVAAPIRAASARALTATFPPRRRIIGSPQRGRRGR